VTIADAVPRGIPAFSSPLTLTQDGDTLRFERSEAVVIAGAQLANANLDLLPTDGSDKRLVDQDADGNPGVTASVKVNFLIKGDIYVVQRLRTSAKGTVTAGKVFQGVPRALTEQSIVGASNPILKVSVTLTPEFDAPENKALWVPVAAGTTCDQVLAKRKQLFNE
jgi:hypothetical protein